jgi:ABC-type multidrug transport system fused ATPase/permease subunit
MAYFTGVLLIRTGLISAFYRKTMRLTPSARSRLTTGLIMTMISTDSSRLSDMCMMLHHIWACPFLISVSMIFLIQFIGVAALGGLGWLVFVLALETVFARLSLIINRKALKATDARLEIVGQVLKNIRIVKLYGWQSAFLGKILDSRQLEVNLIRVFAFTKAMITMLLQVTPVMVALCTFSMYTYLNPDRPLTAVQAFTTLALFNILRQPLTQMPKVLSNIVDAMSCFPRVNQLMDAEELPGCTPYSQLQNLVDAVEQVELGPDSTVPVAKRAASVKDILSEVKNVQPALPEGSIYIPGYDFSYEYPSAASFLPNVQLDIKPGSLVMLVGPVASGKSTLMLSLLGELHTTQNSTLKSNKTVSGKIAYLSQTSWIMNDTVRFFDQFSFFKSSVHISMCLTQVRNNICFGMDYDPIWYARVIASCALESDLASLAAGDMTEIGERGVTLSGGQKARVALARAVYSNADVYLLDSPLSALDVHVGQFVLEQCLCGVLKEKTIVLITHDLPLTRMADQVCKFFYLIFSSFSSKIDLYFFFFI